jgi:hypothetical protein
MGCLRAFLKKRDKKERVCHFFIMTHPPLEVTNEEMENAYGCFMEQVRIVSQSEQDYSEVFRMLNITRIEMVATETIYRYGQGGKCPEICLP